LIPIQSNWLSRLSIHDRWTHVLRWAGAKLWIWTEIQGKATGSD